ncbi:MAG: hypothetical protein F4Z46_06275 [Cenarchaeum sp. SB0667_bin_13]|nr:hypothetical protein [Cenarchaeum sp. SB0667_bin_13]
MDCLNFGEWLAKGRAILEYNRLRWAKPPRHTDTLAWCPTRDGVLYSTALQRYNIRIATSCSIIINVVECCAQ